MKCGQYRPGGVLAAIVSGIMAAMPIPAAGQAPPPAGGDPPDLPRKLEEYGDWRALAAGTGETRACYVTQKVLPAPVEGNAKERPLLYVTHRPGKNALNVVSYFAGYAVKPHSDIELDFGGSRFRLFTQEGSNGAWSPNPETDQRIVEAMKAGISVTVRGIDHSGREIAETFSLQGFTAALARAAQECRGR